MRPRPVAPPSFRQRSECTVESCCFCNAAARRREADGVSPVHQADMEDREGYCCAECMQLIEQGYPFCSTCSCGREVTEPHRARCYTAGRWPPLRDLCQTCGPLHQCNMLSDSDSGVTDEDNPEMSLPGPSAVQPKAPPSFGPSLPPGYPNHAMPAVETDRDTKVRFASGTQFRQRKWSRHDEARQKYSDAATDPSYVKLTEGYVDEKLRKRGIKVHEHLAVMRAKLRNRNAYDRGGSTFIQELHAGAWCQASMIEEEEDGQMECNFAWEKDDLAEWKDDSTEP